MSPQYPTVIPYPPPDLPHPPYPPYTLAREREHKRLAQQFQALQSLAPGMTELDHTQLRRASRALRRWCLTCGRNIVTGEASAVVLQYHKSDGTLSEPVRIKDRAHLVIQRCHARARNHGLTFIHNTDIDQPQVWLAKGGEMIAIY